MRASSSLICYSLASTIACVLPKASGFNAGIVSFGAASAGAMAPALAATAAAPASSVPSGTRIGESSAHLSGLGLLSSSDAEKLEFKGLATSCPTFTYNPSFGPSLPLLLPV